MRLFLYSGRSYRKGHWVNSDSRGTLSRLQCLQQEWTISKKVGGGKRARRGGTRIRKSSPLSLCPEEEGEETSNRRRPIGLGKFDSSNSCIEIYCIFIGFFPFFLTWKKSKYRGTPCQFFFLKPL